MSAPEAVSSKDIELLSRNAGLESAWRQFPDDIEFSIMTARRLVRNLPTPFAPEDDMWPSTLRGAAGE